MQHCCLVKGVFTTSVQLGWLGYVSSLFPEAGRLNKAISLHTFILTTLALSGWNSVTLPCRSGLCVNASEEGILWAPDAVNFHGLLSFLFHFLEECKGSLFSSSESQTQQEVVT